MGILAVDELMLREPTLLVPGKRPLGLVKASTRALELHAQFGAFIAWFGAGQRTCDLISGSPPSSVTVETEPPVQVNNGLLGFYPRQTNAATIFTAIWTPDAQKATGKGFTVVLQQTGLFYSIHDFLQTGAAARGFSIKIDGAYSPTGMAYPKYSVTHRGVADYSATTTVDTPLKTKIHTTVITDDTASVKVYESGRKIDEYNVGTYVQVNPTDQISVGNYYAARIGFRGVTAFCAIIFGAVSDAEAKELSIDPYQLVEPA